MLTVSPLELLATLSVASTTIFLIRHTALKLANANGSDVRIVWYLFSLALTCTILIAAWTSQNKVIDDTGDFQGKAGAFLSKILTSTLDLNAAISIYGSLVLLVVVPQILSWGFSGLFGCASSPIWMRPVFNFFIWSVIKSFVVASGVLLATAAYACTAGWTNSNLKQFILHLDIALVLLASAFGLLFAYRDFPAGVKDGKPNSAAIKVQQMFNIINAWMNRKNPKIKIQETSPTYSFDATYVQATEKAEGWRLFVKKKEGGL